MQSNSKVKSPKFIIDYDRLNESLLLESWSTILAITDISEAFDLFCSLLNNYISQCKHELKQRKQFVVLKPWINKFLISKIRKKNYLQRKLKKHSHIIALSRHYSNYSKKVNKYIKDTKSKYYFTKFQRVVGNSKKQWNLVNEILNKNNCTNEIKVIRDNSGNIVSSPIEIANSVNSYFSNTVASMRSAIDKPNLILNKSMIFDRPINSRFFFRPITPSELFFIINSLETKYTNDHLGLNSAILKRISFNIVDILAELFNRSIIAGVFPEALKNATVIPLYKKGDRLSICNYRPISLLPVVSKIFEKVIKSRIIEFLNKFDYFSSYQFGFSRGTERTFY